MSFLAPLGFLALLTLPLIVILHMLRERRRRVVVPSLLLWQLMPRRQEAQRRRRLPLTLLLLLHLLAAAMLGLALARPQWPLAIFGGERHLAVIVDTSTSMAAPAGAGTRLDAARARARELVGAAGATGSVTLIAAGPEARVIDAGDADDAARLYAALDALVPSGTGADLGGALTLAEAALQGRPGPRVVVLTDGALPTLGAQLDGRAAGVPVEWQPVGGALDNRAVVALAARPRPGAGPIQVYARVVNYSAAPFSTVLRLYGDDAILDTRPVAMDAGGEAELTWAIPRGVTMLRAEVDGGDGLPVDDTFALSLAQSRPVRALLVSTRPAALERALRAVPGLQLTTIDPLVFTGSAADLTIFDGFMPDAWPAGGVLVVHPPPGSPLLAVEARERDARPDTPLQALPAGGLFDGLSLGSVSFGPARVIAPPAGFAPQLLRGEQPLIVRGRDGQSEIAIWAFDLGQGNLTTRLAFPLLVARTVRDLTPPAMPPSAQLGQKLQLRPDPRADRIELGAPDGLVAVIPVTPGTPVEIALPQAGVYALAERAGAELLYEGRLGVNAGAPIESDLTPQALPTAAPEAAAAFGRDDTQRPLWPWLAAAALAIMLIEWLYVHGRRRAVGSP